MVKRARKKSQAPDSMHRFCGACPPCKDHTAGHQHWHPSTLKNTPAHSKAGYSNVPNTQLQHPEYGPLDDLESPQQGHLTGLSRGEVSGALLMIVTECMEEQALQSKCRYMWAGVQLRH